MSMEPTAESASIAYRKADIPCLPWTWSSGYNMSCPSKSTAHYLPSSHCSTACVDYHNFITQTFRMHHQTNTPIITIKFKTSHNEHTNLPVPPPHLSFFCFPRLGPVHPR